MSETTTNRFEKAYGNLQNLSRTWAIAALDSTSHSLKATADFLSNLSAKLTVEPVEEAEVEAEEEAPEAKN